MKKIMIIPVVAFCLLPLFAGEQKSEDVKDAKFSVEDYLRLKVGNRWVLQMAGEEKWTFEIEEKTSECSFNIRVSTSGKKESGTAVWEVKDGFFVMEMKKDSPVKVLTIPPEKGKQWTFSTSSKDTVGNARIMAMGRLPLNVGTLENCIASELRVIFEEHAKMTRYLFAPGFGLAGIESYVDNQPVAKAVVVEARLDGVVYHGANKFKPSDVPQINKTDGETKPERDSGKPDIDVEKEKELAGRAFEAAIKKFLARDFKGFYQCFSADYRKNNPFESFKKGLEKDFQETEKMISRLVVREVVIKNGEILKAEVKAVMKDVPDSEDIVQMVKEEGSWKILNLR